MSAVKNSVEVWSRLFDHKPFLQAELNSFVHEFEDNRKDREVVNLLDVLNIECEINNQFNAISNFNSCSLQLLDKKINECVKQTNDILNCDTILSEKSVLETRRKARATSWEAYKEGMEPKYSQFDEELKKELQQFKKFYENSSAVSRNN